MFSVVRSRGVVSRRVLALAAYSKQLQSKSFSIGPVVNEAAPSTSHIRHAQSLSSNTTHVPPPDIILTGRASPSKRSVAPPLDAAGQLNLSIQTLKQSGYQSTNREWLTVIFELSKLKRYGEITSLWKQWMSTLPSGTALKQMSVSEKKMFLPSEAIFVMLLKCPAAVVTGDQALQYLDAWRMDMTGQLHRLMVVRLVHAGDLQSASRWMLDLFKRGLRSSPAIETALFRQLFADPLFTDQCHDLAARAWDRSLSSSANLDAGWCAALLQVFVQNNDQSRCSQMAQKLLNSQIGSNSFSAPELYGPLVDVLSQSNSVDQADALIRHWQTNARNLDMNLIASSKQTVRSLLDNEAIDSCVSYVLTQNSFGNLLRSSYALILHVLEKKERVSDIQQVWMSWMSSISNDSIASLTAVERSALLPHEADFAFVLGLESSFLTCEEALSLLESLGMSSSVTVYNAILSRKASDDDFEGVISWYQSAIEAGFTPNEHTIAPVVSAVRHLLQSDAPCPTYLHSVIVSVWDCCMSSTAPLTSEWADIFLSSFEHYEDETRAVQLIECILSPKVTGSTPKLVGSFITRVNVMLLKKGQKPLLRACESSPRVIDTRDRRAIDS